MASGLTQSGGSPETRIRRRVSVEGVSRQDSVGRSAVGCSPVRLPLMTWWRRAGDMTGYPLESWLSRSSGVVLIVLVDGPGGGFVVGDVVAEAAMQIPTRRLESAAEHRRYWARSGFRPLLDADPRHRLAAVFAELARAI